MTDGVFFFDGNFREGFSKRRIIKDRVIAKTALAAGGVGQKTFHALFCRKDNLIALGKYGGADKTRSAFLSRDAFYIIKHFLQVLFICRIFTVGVAGRVDAGASIQGVNRKAGVVRQGQQSGMLRCSHGLEFGVGEKGIAGFFDVRRVGIVALRDDVPAQTREQRLQFFLFFMIARSNE